MSQTQTQPATRRSKRGRLLYSVAGETASGLEIHYIVADNEGEAAQFARAELLLETVVCVRLENDCVHV
jgi:hypothetical protein